MLNTISHYSHQIATVAREKIHFPLTEQQKKVALIAALALSLLAAATFAVCRCFCKSKPSEIKTDKADGANVKDKNDPSTYTPFEKAMDLMFEDRTLEWGVQLPSLTGEKRQERYDELKKNIDLLSEDKVNQSLTYRDGMMGRTQTLLLQAIMCITDPAHRFEIAEMLIKKGANPYVEGFYYSPIQVKEEVLKTNDAQLITLIEDALKRQKLAQLVSKGIAVRPVDA